MEQTKVLIVTQQYTPEGNAFRISDMAVHLNNDKTKVTILSPHPTIPIGSFEKTWKISHYKKIDNVDVYNIWAWQPSSKNPDFITRMAYYLTFPVHVSIWILLNHKKFDVIITSTPPIFIDFPGIIAKYVLRKSWIIDIRDLWIEASVSLGFIKKGSLYEKLSRAFEQYCLIKSDLITVTTSELKNRLLEQYKRFSQNKVVVVPNGVDTERFNPGQNAKKLQMIYSGNVGHAQDLEKVILAMQKVKAKYDLKFVIVGDGDIKNQLIDVTEKNNLENDIIFTGAVPRSEIPGRISESMIGVAPLKDLQSLEYAIPTKVYEYMACGIPFIGCGKGEIQNIADESHAGFVAKNDSDDIANRIIALLDDRKLMDDMGRSGREYARKYCDRKAIAYSLEAYINQTVEYRDAKSKKPALDSDSQVN